MKKIIPFIAFLILLNSCKEQPVTIPNLSAQSQGNRKVLIEEFTGVRCVNCPQGADEIASLQTKYGENLIAVAIHAGFFAPPYKESKEDFRIPKGQQLQEYLGEPLGYPSAVINRTHFQGIDGLQIGQVAWSGYIQQEFQKNAALNIRIENKYDATTQILITTITAIALENINSPLKITIMLSEDKIEDYQLTLAGLNPNYNHRHALRAILSNFDGNPLTSSSIIKGEIITQTLTTTLSKQWKIKNCNIIALVHNPTNKEVLQVEENKIE